jgi:site-specific DNA recombinase
MPASLYAACEEIYPVRTHIIYAAYVRESDPSLEYSATIESQKQAVREHCIKLGGELSEDLIYAEALSSTKLSYRQRPKILAALDAAKQGLFHKLLVNEFGGLARKQVEQAVLIEMFKEYGVEVISCTEHFDDSPTGNFLRAAFSFNSEMEALKITERTSRGKRDRARLGKRLLGMGQPGYGYKWADETKSAYAINDTIFYVDLDGTEWSEYRIVVFIFDKLDEGWALRRVRDYLLEKGIPTRRGKPVWGRQTIHQIASCPNYTGKAVAFRWQKVEGKKHMVIREEEEQIPLPDGTIPAIVSVEKFERIQKQFEINKQGSIRNSKWPESNLMRAGLLKCGLCGRHCRAKHPTPHGYPIHTYECYDYDSAGNRHGIAILARTVDEEAWAMAKEHIRCPQLVLDRANSIIAERRENDDSRTIHKSLDGVKKKISNLLTMAEDATDKDELQDIRIRIGGLQRQKRELEKMLIDIANEDEQRAAFH